MSTSASDGTVVQMGKLVVHIAENGHSYELDCDEYTLVEAMQKYLESVSGIPLTEQLLLCLDMKLESQRPLSAYKLPSDDRELFLFNKSRMRSSSLPPAPEQADVINIPDPPAPSSSNNPHPLDEAPDPALKALPSYERQFRYHFQCGHAIYSRTLAKFETCERLLLEQKVQERALEIARGNLDYFYKIVLQNYADFMKCYSQQHRGHTGLLVNFGRDMERLRSVRLHPSLQTGNRKCLLDFVKEENLQKTVEDCGSSHRQFENKVSEFKQEFGDLKRNVENLFSGRASFFVKDLDSAMKEHQPFINEQKSIMQALSKDVNTVKKLVDDCLSSELSSSLRPHDAVSALGPMYDSHEKSYLPKMHACDHAISNLLDFCRDKKSEMNTFVHTYMQKIAYIQYTIKDVRYKFSVFQEALKRQNDQFEHLKVVRGIGTAYRACLAEIVRRKAEMKIYMGKAGQLAEKLATERDSEVRRREDFLKVHVTFIPRDVLSSMGLYDTPNPCDVNVTPFDTNLLDIDLPDIDRYAPDLLLVASLRSDKHGSFKTSLSMSNDDSEASLDESELVEIAGTSKLEVENAKLKAELASKIALLCSMSVELDYESIDDTKLENVLKNAAEKTSEALHLKEQYEKHLQSMLKVKQMQCESYEKRIHELEQRLSDQYITGLKLNNDEDASGSGVSTAKTNDNKLEVSQTGEAHMPRGMEEVFCALKSGLVPDHDDSKAHEGLDDNMTDSSSTMNPQLDSSMVDFQRDKGHTCDKDKKEETDEGTTLATSNMAVSMSQPADAVSYETALEPAKLSDDLVVELQKALAEKSIQLDNAETEIQGLMDEVSKLGRDLEIGQKLIDESQMNCAHLENCLHEARKEAQTNLCAADRRASEYSALRVSAVKMRGLFERLRSCVFSANFPDSLRGLAQSLGSASANEGEDDGTAEFRECIRVLADEVGLLSRQRAELLDRHSKAETANEQLSKELGEKKELVTALYMKHQLEKQANKEKISFSRLEVHEIGAFILNSAGYYEAINRSCTYYYLSTESVALFTDHLPIRPTYIVGQVVHIERGTVKSPPSTLERVGGVKDRADFAMNEMGTNQLTLHPGSGSGSGPNPYGLAVGCEYFVVTIAMLPNTAIRSPPS